MSTVELTSQDFERTISDNDLVLVEFWADWCPPCRTFAPILESASERHPNLLVATVNTMQQPDLAQRFNVLTIPTIMLFREQVLVHARTGAISPAALDELIEQVQALDMDEVRDAMIGARQLVE